MPNVSDVIIIGGGPVGLFAAFYSGMRGMACEIIDSLGQLGGQLSALYPKKYIYDVPGYTKVTAESLISELGKQAKQFDPIVHLEEKVIKLGYDSEDKSVIRLESEKGNTYFSKSVIISAGAGAFMPRKLDVHDIDDLENKGLYYFVRDPNIFKGKRLVVVGGGDSAVDWTLTLEPLAKEIVLLNRSDRFLAHEDSLKKLFSSSVKVNTFTEISEVYCEDAITGVRLVNTRSKNEERVLDCDAILCCIGFITNLGPIKEWGFELEKNAIKVDKTMETNITGVWAAGDIASYPGKLKLIATGFADAAVAVNMAKHYIDPEAKIYPGKSSAKKWIFKF